VVGRYLVGDESPHLHTLCISLTQHFRDIRGEVRLDLCSSDLVSRPNRAGNESTVEGAA
jgi:hypothetical protein